MAKWPEEFTHILALVLLNVVSGRTFIERGAENLHLDPEKAASRLDERLRELTGFRLDEETPLPYAQHVKVPTLMAQLRRDFLVHGERDGQAIFDALGAQEKELLWIEQSNQRFYSVCRMAIRKRIVRDVSVKSKYNWMIDCYGPSGSTTCPTCSDRR
jgi:hypothetical protein